jgi:hypothetical protein
VNSVTPTVLQIILNLSLSEYKTPRPWNEFKRPSVNLRMNSRAPGSLKCEF